MKKAFLIIGIMIAAIMASAQDYSRHTFHWGDGTSTTVTTIGSHTYVHDNNPKPLVFFDVYNCDTLCGKVDIQYGLYKPEIDTMYAIFLEPGSCQDILEIGKLHITKECKGGHPGTCVIEFNEGYGIEDLTYHLKRTFIIKCSDTGYRIVDSMKGMSKRQKKRKMRHEYNDIYMSDGWTLLTKSDSVWNDFDCLFWNKK